jgi:hypothetical protein
MRGSFRRRADGSVDVRLSEQEAAAIRHVAGEVGEALADPGAEGLRRLFPPAYAEDPKREAEYAEMTRDDLVEQKRAAARAVVGSIDAGTTRRGRWSASLPPDAATAWLTVINDARLMLGTKLDVTEEMDHNPLPANHPQAQERNLYLYLSALEEALVGELLQEFPSGGTDD